MLILSNLEAAL